MNSSAVWDVVILGAGMGGLSAAVRLRELAPPARRILVVEAAPWHTLRPKLPEAVAGYCRCSVRLPIGDLLSQRRISFLQAEVRVIDPLAHQVRVQAGTDVQSLQYRTLIVALGSVAALPTGPGDVTRLHPFWSFDDACALRRRLSLLAARAKRQRDAGAVSVAVVGGGFVGTEVASAVAGLTHALLADTSLQPRVTLVERASRILPLQPEPFSHRVTATLESRGVRVEAGRPVMDIGPDSLTLADGTRVPAATVVWTGGVQPHPALSTLGSAVRGGRIPVSNRLEAQAWADVFAVGDVAASPGSDPPAPFDHSASLAASMGRLAAENVAAQWRGRPGRPFRPHPAPLLIEFDPRHVLGLTPGGRTLVRAAPVLKQVAMARHIWRVGGGRTLVAMFRATLWEPWRRRAPEVRCPSPEVQETIPTLFPNLSSRP